MGAGRLSHSDLAHVISCPALKLALILTLIVTLNTLALTLIVTLNRLASPSPITLTLTLTLTSHLSP